MSPFAMVTDFTPYIRQSENQSLTRAEIFFQLGPVIMGAISLGSRGAENFAS